MGKPAWLNEALHPEPSDREGPCVDLEIVCGWCKYHRQTTKPAPYGSACVHPDVMTEKGTGKPDPKCPFVVSFVQRELDCHFPGLFVRRG
jgi:hypothetical protein